MEFRMELVTETQASVRHTGGVPEGQGQEANERRAVKVPRGPGANAPPGPDLVGWLLDPSWAQTQ